MGFCALRLQKMVEADLVSEKGGKRVDLVKMADLDSAISEWESQGEKYLEEKAEFWEKYSQSCEKAVAKNDGTIQGLKSWYDSQSFCEYPLEESSARDEVRKAMKAKLEDRWEKTRILKELVLAEPSLVAEEGNFGIVEDIIPL